MAFIYLVRNEEPDGGQPHLGEKEEEEAEREELQEAHVLPEGADAAGEAHHEDHAAHQHLYVRHCKVNHNKKENNQQTNKQTMRKATLKMTSKAFSSLKPSPDDHLSRMA